MSLGYVQRESSILVTYLHRCGSLSSSLSLVAHAVHGFTNRDLRGKLTATPVRLNPDPLRQRAEVSRLLSRLHVYGLVAKIPRSRRWRVTAFGHRVMSASVRLRQLHFPPLLRGRRVTAPEDFVAKSREPDAGRIYALFINTA